MMNPAASRILRIKPYQPGKPIDEARRELGLKQVVKLASNESSYGPSPRVCKAMEKELKNVNRYPDGGCFYLRRELARHLNIPEQQLVFGNGSDEIIVLALRAFVKEGDEVIVARPSFLIYEIASKIVGARVKSVPLKNFCYDLEKMARVVTPKTKMIFIGNPDNPSGTYVSQKDLKDFLNRLRRDILVFIDEAYHEYVLARDYPDTVKLLKTHKNIITTRTFSKLYGLAGLRIGYGMAALPVIDILNRVREPFNVNSLAQAAAWACLKDQRYYRRIAAAVEEQKQYLYQQFSLMGLSFVKTATNFILVDLKEKKNKIPRKLLKKGVIIRDMCFWGLDSFIRVTIGTEKENQRFVKALREELE